MYSISAFHEQTEKPSLAPRQMHSHNDYEIFFLLSGDVDYRVEGEGYPLSPGDLVLMRRGEVHIPHIRSAAPYQRMHVNFDLGSALPEEDAAKLLAAFDERPLGKFNHYPAALFPGNRFRETMEKLCCEKDSTLRLCALLSLLGELCADFEQLRRAPAHTKQDPVSPVIRFVNENLTQPLSVEALAGRFFLSKTHLNRLFRRSTGTTVWQYITVKRLFLAKEMLEKGEKPTKAAHLAGFAEYTSFFRAYQKHFGKSPRESVRTTGAG